MVATIVAEKPSAARATAAMLDKSEQQQSVRNDPKPQDGKDREQPLIDGLLRYLEDFRGPMKWLHCGLVQSDQTLPGFAVIIGRTFWFFDYHDCLVDDIADGSPIYLQREEIVGCSVMKPERVQVSNEESLKVEFLPSMNENLVSIIIETDGPDVALIAASGRELDQEDRLRIERNIDGFIHLIDWAFLRVASATNPQAASSVGYNQGVAQYFTAEGIHDLSGSMNAPARLYLDEDFLPGSLVIAGHLLGFFPEDDGNNSEQEPLMVSFHDITKIHLSVPEGLELIVPRGVHSDTILNGTVLGLYMSLETTHVSLIFDYPRHDDAGPERAHVHWCQWPIGTILGKSRHLIWTVVARF